MGVILGLINGLSILVTAVVISFLPLCLLAPTAGWTEETLVRRIKDGRQVAVISAPLLASPLSQLLKTVPVPMGVG